MRHILFVMALLAVQACTESPPAQSPLTTSAAVEPAVTYIVDTLPTLGGRLNRPSGINNDGAVAGFANLPGDTIRHAVLWREGVATDLLTLGGENSNVQWPGISNSGLIAGIFEIDEPDTLNESWSCTAFFPRNTGKRCRGFIWSNGTMSPLPTLGGDQGFAAGVNSRGQVVGWAETPVVDPTCNSPQVLQFRATLWDTRKGQTIELPPYPGDSTSAATAINEQGQVVGISGECDIAVGQRSARIAVLWENGTVTPIGGLGGEFWHTPMDLNEVGQVVGFSNPSGVLGIDFRPHAFSWTRDGGIVDLGTLLDDSTSQALASTSRARSSAYPAGRGATGRSCSRAAS
jgi:probable HAF family extracellular repeat protein